MTDPIAVVELDDRRRVTLGRSATHDRYFMHVEPDGTIVLVPAVLMTQTEAALAANPVLAAKIDAFLADPSKGVRRGRPTRKDSPTSA